MFLIIRIIGLFSFIIFSPIIIMSATVIFLHDFKNPFHLHMRVGKNGDYFTLYKLRTMRKNTGFKNFLATASNDKRLFLFGKFIRKYKIDELPQFINLFIGDMNIIGPRPNIIDLVKEYSSSELCLFDVKPGITDIATLVFSNYNKLLSKSQNPDIYYKKMIRPKKFKMSQFYIHNKSLQLNLIIFICTIIGIFNSYYGKKLLLKHISEKYDYQF
jgi:lipopolysaccharide/colanic/teichoic acid biosynthesis glycosyltransferase